jgi:hypothetical protein
VESDEEQAEHDQVHTAEVKAEQISEEAERGDQGEHQLVLLRSAVIVHILNRIFARAVWYWHWRRHVHGDEALGGERPFWYVPVEVRPPVA